MYKLFKYYDTYDNNAYIIKVYDEFLYLKCNNEYLCSYDKLSDICEMIKKDVDTKLAHNSNMVTFLKYANCEMICKFDKLFELITIKDEHPEYFI